ncbi:MAG: signal recognition particle subunit SRP19/SEC65 family protein [Thermoplasmata archaeon]
MPDHFYVYPAYLSAELSRRDGRRVPASMASSQVSSAEIAAAAKRLGFQAEIEPNKQYPRQFFAYAGRVKIAKADGTTKAGFLTALAAEIHKSRPPAGTRA